MLETKYPVLAKLSTEQKSLCHAFIPSYRDGVNSISIGTSKTNVESICSTLGWEFPDVSQLESDFFMIDLESIESDVKRVYKALPLTTDNDIAMIGYYFENDVITVTKEYHNKPNGVLLQRFVDGTKVDEHMEIPGEHSDWGGHADVLTHVNDIYNVPVSVTHREGENQSYIHVMDMLDNYL